MAMSAMRTAVAAAIASITLAAPAAASPDEQRDPNRAQKRPNVIVIETDDQSNSLRGMNNVARLLASKGTTFANSYAAYPLCCPSRATFLTGQYSHNNRVISTDLIQGYGALDETRTLPVWLGRSGYRTAMVGRYLNGYGTDDGVVEEVRDTRQIPPGWSEWYALTAGTDQRRYNYRLNENGKVRRYGKRPSDYVTDVLAGHAVDFIERRAPRPKPFFLWFTPSAPHGEQSRGPGASRDPTPAPRHLGRFADATLPRTPAFNEEDVSDKPARLRATPPLSPGTVADLDLRYRSQLESLLAVDDAVKRMVGRIRRAGDKRMTYFVFTSDNGLQMGSHRLLFKSFLYEESTRVPLVIRGPRFPRGVVREQLVSNVDLAPTISALARVRPTLPMDGRSLLGPARDPSVLSGRELLLESNKTNSVAVRSGDWVYIEHAGGDRELYDLAADPFQLESLHASPPHAAIRDRLAARLAQVRDCLGPSCP